jgi:NAD(P)H-nitrite reductase large subunit
MPSLICFCFRVEKGPIVDAIAAGASTVDELSAKLRVCMGCGGCRPDVENLLRFYGEERDAAPPLPKA